MRIIPLEVDDDGLPVSDTIISFDWKTETKDVVEQLNEGLKSFGFDYTTVAFVWDKKNINAGFYTLSQTELVIVGKKGKIPQPRGSRNERQFLSKARTVHSEKPEEIRERITRMHPSQNKLEMFARHNVTGWDTFGNQTGALDKLVLPTDLFENFYS